MNILNIEHIRKIHGEKVIFDDVSLGVSEGEKIGIIGINGTGKSTLLNILAGREEADEGRVVVQNGLRISYLSQNPQFPRDSSVIDYVASGKWLKDWDTQSEAAKILNRLGFANHQEKTGNLSGGQKKRAALARVLMNDADILVLDEPTNHLDNEMVTWLERFLQNYKGVVVMVTHDRYFLDSVANRILEISHGKIYSYEANYSRFLELKSQREDMELASERKRQSVLRMELEWAKRGCRARSTKQKARLERLEALKKGVSPVEDAKVELDSVETRMGKKTIEIQHMSKRYGEKILVKDFSYVLRKNQRLGFIGPNGCGKSTLLKMIGGILAPDEGEIQWGETIRMGYFAQEVPDMDSRLRVIDYIRETAEYIPTRDGKISASMMLERFLFDSAMQYTPVERLSGGEKRRLYLCKVLMEAPNVLLLDEPGNDLDIPTLTILEDYLDSFAGIVIFVSHDRYFLDNVAQRIYAFEGEGRLIPYEGGYTDYLEARKRREEPVVGGEASGGSTKVSGNTRKDWKQNRGERLKFTFKEQREYETIDGEIAALEEKQKALEAEMEANATNSFKLSQIMEEKERTGQELEQKLERWVYLNDLAEAIEQQKG